MARKYPVVTLCGSTRFKNQFMQIQKELTLRGYIVVSVGWFGHTGDEEVWAGMNEGTVTETKMMLDDINKCKIDMADEIYVVNPGGYIGESTWSEICYAKMTEKKIESMEIISQGIIENHVSENIKLAEQLAWNQIDWIRHSDGYYNIADFVRFTYKKKDIVDPWISLETHYDGTPWIDHNDPGQKVDPFKTYGNKKMARFIEKIIAREKVMK